jgi:glycosyltransferase involved in cell wall biosynthesis
MFHEVAVPFDRTQPIGQNILAAVTTTMAAIVARSADRAFVSTDAWKPAVHRFVRAGIDVTCVPVPSSVPVSDDALAVSAVRRTFEGAERVVGHFGTFGRLIVPMLGEVLALLGASGRCHVLLIGRGSDRAAAAYAAAVPALRGRIVGTGPLDPDDLSRHISACDVLLQPYPDGVTTRRTSVMAGLSHGRPVVTNIGRLSEELWLPSGAVMAADTNPRAIAAAVEEVLGDAELASSLATRGRRLYEQCFDVRHTIAALRADAAVPLRAVS